MGWLCISVQVGCLVAKRNSEGGLSPIFLLSRHPITTDGKCLDGMWSPIFDGVVSDKRVVKLLCMRKSLLHKQPIPIERDG